VISFVTKRGNQEKPQITCLDILAGDTTQLQSRIKDYLINFHDSKWSCEAVIDQLSKYNLSLQSKIRIQNKIYAITELERNYNDDEYKVKAWLL
jgi:superfamily II RNA helicase